MLKALTSSTIQLPFRARSTPKVLRVFQNSLHATEVNKGNAKIASSNFKAQVKAENEDVSTMNTFMKAVRESSDPTFHNIMPLRIPVL
ncbi:hypothetical protein CPB83DRAFT_279983 [Crepidotus variabilis]|uniref:Uncharacterized protein n=1 Tax=Crepidotus variabilis TaxID=179855 RepID=A0A9P6JPZ7_9AGAR|nr:hypothetical protein CPB83DRAFT_279983 [Crepidotus variabilis]